MNQIITIVGAQWGDEGKGKITDVFAKDADYVVRFHGGNNAGHTLVVGDQTYKLHLIPSGVLYPNVVSVVGNGVVVDPGVLIQEIEGLKERGVEPNLRISERAHVIMPYHIAMDEALSNHQGKLAAGSTKRGIAPVCADKMYRHGIRIGDLLDPALFAEKLEASYDFNVSILSKVFHHEFESTKEMIAQQFLAYGKQLVPYVGDTEVELYKAYQSGKHILFEGAQGMSLDPDHGMYPHTTSTNNVAGYASVGSGLGHNREMRVIGVVKAYMSRVGVSPFPTELESATGDELREKGHEYGTTTGRPRRVGWTDLVQVKQSVRTSGLTDLAITKLDILNGMEEIKLCVAYEVDGEKIEEMPASLTMLRKAKPVYETFKGWQALSKEEMDALIDQGYQALPNEMKTFIEYIEKSVDCRASIISLGPKRRQTIIRSL